MGKQVSKETAAKMLEVSPRTIERAVRCGELVAVYGGLHKNRIVGITVASIDALRDRNATK